MQTATAFAHRAPTAAASSDADLAARAAAGDDNAFEAIMRRHNRLLFRTARSILRGDAEAEDALQEAYLRAWRALPRFRADAKLSTWLTRIVINEALGRLRRHDARVIPLQAAATDDGVTLEDATPGDAEREPERAAMRSEMRGLMEACIDRLPAAFRTVFVLRAVEELSVEEVASALVLPEATVRTRYFRARALLRDALSRELDFALGDAFGFDGARCDRVVAGVRLRLSAAPVPAPHPWSPPCPSC